LRTSSRGVYFGSREDCIRDMESLQMDRFLDRTRASEDWPVVLCFV
jgi:hypothetical protein